MATTKPRITITLPSRTYEVLTRFSAASGEPMSQVVAGFVDLAVPSLERLVVVLERARDAPEEVRAGLVAAFERADRDLMPLLVGATRQGEMFLADQAGAVASRPGEDAQRPPQAGAVSGRSDPRPVIRGLGGVRKAQAGAGDGPV